MISAAESVNRIRMARELAAVIAESTDAPVQRARTMSRTQWWIAGQAAQIRLQRRSLRASYIPSNSTRALAIEQLKSAHLAGAS